MTPERKANKIRYGLILMALAWLALVGLGMCARAAVGQEIDLRVEYTHITPPTEEPENRVRMGSASGMDLSFGMHLSGELTENLDGYLHARLMPSFLCVWEKGGPVERPRGCDYPFLWSTYSFGVRYGFAEAGLGIASISSASHDYWGAVPMHAPLVELSASPNWPIGSFQVGPTCTAQAILPRVLGDGYTVLERAAGVGPEEPLERGGQNFATINCGLSIGVSF